MKDISKQVVKSKGFRRQTKGCMAVFFENCEKCYRKSWKYMRNTLTRPKSKKKFNFTISKFRAQRYEDIWPAKAEKPWRGKGVAHADMVSDWIWKLYSKRRPAGKLAWCEPPRDHLDYLYRGKAVTTLRLEKSVFRHTLGARTFYTSPLRKCQETKRKTFRLAIFRLFNVKWIMHNILSFTKGIFNNQWNLSEEKMERTFKTPCIYHQVDMSRPLLGFL